MKLKPQQNLRWISNALLKIPVAEKLEFRCAQMPLMCGIGKIDFIRNFRPVAVAKMEEISLSGKMLARIFNF